MYYVVLCSKHLNVKRNKYYTERSRGKKYVEDGMVNALILLAQW